MKKATTVSLVLGSGGARGLAHIGIIRWLETNGYKIESISGCSMGALVGGIYAIGKMDAYEKWVRSVSKADMVALLDLAFGTDGLFKGTKIINTLKDLVGDARIEELPISYTAVASNIARAKEVWINEGPIFDAIRASISMPIFFTPHRYKGQELVDGGILNPVPIAPTFSDLTDVTIAVNLCGRPKEGLNLDDFTIEEEKPMLISGISDFIDKIKASMPNQGFTLRSSNILSQSFDTMQGTIARQKIAAYPPDYVLEVPKNLCMILDFDRADELIRYGYQLAGKMLPDVLNQDGVKRYDMIESS